MAWTNNTGTTYLNTDISTNLRKVKGYKAELYSPSVARVTEPTLTNIPVIDKRMEHLSTNYRSRAAAVNRRNRAR